jgi:hypothetical protein
LEQLVVLFLNQPDRSRAAQNHTLIDGRGSGKAKANLCFVALPAGITQTLQISRKDGAVEGW